jgi:N-acetylneuraminic acid mutarotase
MSTAELENGATMMLNRRSLIAGGLGVVATSAFAQHEHHSGQFERLNASGRIDLPDLHRQHAVTESSAPAAPRQGQWQPRAPLPLPRTEMAWAAEYRGRVHLVGGYAEQQVDKPYHHAYDTGSDRWEELPQLPRGANHVGVAALGDRLYAFGGFTEQNRNPHDGVFAFDGERWHTLRRLPEACGAIACVALGDEIHLIGGAIGTDNRRSIDWHLVYNPAEDRYSRRKPMPLGRDHTGVVAVNGVIHLIAGRVDSFHTNSNLHHTYNPNTDEWTARAPIPTARSGHGTVWYRDRIFVMGGEGTNRVYGQTEAYDPVRNTWESYAPMLTPRHGMGAVAVDDAIYVAGGGPQMGGGVKSAINEAFSLA